MTAEKSNFEVYFSVLTDGWFESDAKSKVSANLLTLALIDFSLSTSVSLVTSYYRICSKVAPLLL